MTSTKLNQYNRLIFFLSILGMAIAGYVLFGYFRNISIVCLNNGCDLVRKNFASYIFGIPVPAFGFIGYALLSVLSFLRSFKDSRNLLKIILGISIFGFFFVAWFTYTEIFVIRAICTWCAVSAVLMTTIFFLSLKSYKIIKSEKQGGKNV